MELDSKNLGRLRRVADPREVWLSESGDFTPWLAENIDILADELGMTLTVTATEVFVGQFRLDIQAMDENEQVVIIENQLERTDHSHLGQCLVYAAGLDASTVVWISHQFRDEFRQTFDWLNERTDANIHFFGVEVSVVQIGDTGPRAPVFEVVSRPNDWQKGVKSAAGTPSQGGVSPLNEARQALYGEILERFNAERPSVRVPSRNNQSWITFASGPFGAWSISQVADGRIRVEAYLDCGDRARNKALFDEFEASRDHWQTKVGTELAFERLDDRRASRIGVYHPPVHLAEGFPAAEREQLVAWGVQTLKSMFDAMNEPLRSRAKELRLSLDDSSIPAAAEREEHQDGQ